MLNKKLKPAIALITILTVALLSGCLKDGQQTEQTTNGGFKVDLLFEKDGCKIYRFMDGGRAIYWTDCRGKTEYVYSQQSGKSVYTDYIQNETIK